MICRCNREIEPRVSLSARPWQILRARSPVGFRMVLSHAQAFRSVSSNRAFGTLGYCSQPSDGVTKGGHCTQHQTGWAPPHHGKTGVQLVKPHSLRFRIHSNRTSRRRLQHSKERVGRRLETCVPGVASTPRPSAETCAILRQGLR